MPEFDVPAVSPAVDLRSVTTVLCDADGTLFDSEEPAFAASVVVANQCLQRLGVTERYQAEELRRAATGQSFRATLTMLARSHGVAPDEPPFATDLDAWVAQENAAVTAHLAAVLRPEPQVQGPLRRLGARFGLALVTSSSLTRVDASLVGSGLADLFPPDRRYGAQDSLPVPTSKPDPAIYRLALQRLDLAPGQAVAVEDAVPGVRSAVAAGIATFGLLCFVPPAERAGRAADLRAAGASALVDTWDALAELLEPTAGPRPDPTPTPRRAP